MACWPETVIWILSGEGEGYEEDLKVPVSSSWLT